MAAEPQNIGPDVELVDRIKRQLPSKTSVITEVGFWIATNGAETPEEIVPRAVYTELQEKVDRIANDTSISNEDVFPLSNAIAQYKKRFADIRPTKEELAQTRQKIYDANNQIRKLGTPSARASLESYDEILQTELPSGLRLLNRAYRSTEMYSGTYLAEAVVTRAVKLDEIEQAITGAQSPEQAAELAKEFIRKREESGNLGEFNAFIEKRIESSNQVLSALGRKCAEVSAEVTSTEIRAIAEEHEEATRLVRKLNNEIVEDPVDIHRGNRQIRDALEEFQNHYAQQNRTALVTDLEEIERAFKREERYSDSDQAFLRQVRKARESLESSNTKIQKIRTYIQQQLQQSKGLRQIVEEYASAAQLPINFNELLDASDFNRKGFYDATTYRTLSNFATVVEQLSENIPKLVESRENAATKIKQQTTQLLSSNSDFMQQVGQYATGLYINRRAREEIQKAEEELNALANQRRAAILADKDNIAAMIKNMNDIADRILTNVANQKVRKEVEIIIDRQKAPQLEARIPERQLTPEELAEKVASATEQLDAMNNAIVSTILKFGPLRLSGANRVIEFLDYFYENNPILRQYEDWFNDPEAVKSPTPLYNLMSRYRVLRTFAVTTRDSLTKIAELQRNNSDLLDEKAKLAAEYEILKDTYKKAIDAAIAERDTLNLRIANADQRAATYERLTRKLSRNRKDILEQLYNALDTHEVLMENSGNLVLARMALQQITRLSTPESWIRESSLDNPPTGIILPITQEQTVVGREIYKGALNTIQSGISRNHIALKQTSEGKFTVRDMSRNGTTIFSFGDHSTAQLGGSTREINGGELITLHNSYAQYYTMRLSTGAVVAILVPPTLANDVNDLIKSNHYDLAFMLLEYSSRQALSIAEILKLRENVVTQIRETSRLDKALKEEKKEHKKTSDYLKQARSRITRALGALKGPGINFVAKINQAANILLEPDVEENDQT